jgi:uncharacterized membrane protein YphA (DoxX/SURF4 family)
MATPTAPSSSPPETASSAPTTASSRHAWLWAATILRVGLGTVAIVAGAAKTSDLRASVRAVRAYQLLPDPLAVLTGNVLPIVEITLGALLVLGLFTRWSALAFGLTLVAFTVGIASAWSRGFAIECGCFGGGGLTDQSKTTYLVDLLRDIGLIAVAAVLVWRPSSRLSFDSALAPSI